MSDAELKRVALDFREGLLGGGDSAFQCVAVCYPLASLLTTQGVDIRLATGTVSHSELFCYHTWLQLADGRILDPTADQFARPNGRRMPKVYLGTQPRWYRREKMFKQCKKSEVAE